MFAVLLAVLFCEDLIVRENYVRLAVLFCEDLIVRENYVRLAVLFCEDLVVREITYFWQYYFVLYFLWHDGHSREIRY